MTALKSPAGSLRAMAGIVVIRTLGFGVLWWLLLSGDQASWVIATFAVPLAVWCSLWLFPAAVPLPASDSGKSLIIRTLALIRFALFFMWQSLSGGWESARFALGPKASVKPGFLHFTVQLPEGKPRVFFLQLVGMLPGTVSVALEGDDLLIHALDREADNHGAVARCEAQVAAVFNVPIVFMADEQVKPQ